MRAILNVHAGCIWPAGSRFPALKLPESKLRLLAQKSAAVASAVHSTNTKTHASVNVDTKSTLLFETNPQFGAVHLICGISKRQFP